MENTPILTVRNLSHVFTNGGTQDLHVLHDISFSVYSQQFVCVLGASGSGKSTLLRLLDGLLTPTEGKIVIEGKAQTGPRRSVGMVFQKANLMPWRTVKQNIALPLNLQGVSAEAVEQQTQQLIELVGLEGFADTLPRDLSGGMAQRVAIARALVHDPTILLLDEPFGSLDALTRERMSAELLRIWHANKKTVVMVTHSINEAIFLADRVLVLGPRPARLRLDLEIDIPRPRSPEIIYTEQFGQYALRLREAIGK
jgi:NitT/TauT family transport system ATP-binding protein